MDQNYYIGLVRARLGYKANASRDLPYDILDIHGNICRSKSYIEQNEQILQYLELSLKRFNLLFDKDFKLDDPKLNQFTDLIVQGAVIAALAARALLENGRDFSFSSEGVAVAQSNVSELLTKQWINEQVDYDAKVRYLHKQYCYIEPSLPHLPD